MQRQEHPGSLQSFFRSSYRSTHCRISARFGFSQSVGASLVTVRLKALKDFTGLEKVKSIGSDFVVEGVWHLENFNGLNNLRKASTILTFKLLLSIACQLHSLSLATHEAGVSCLEILSAMRS